jgi:PIN domain nuclease of toxin-antitoxin system
LRLLLDTHAFLWAASEPEKLSLAAREAIESPDNELNLSTISALEVALKVRRRRLDLMMTASDLRAAAVRLGVRYVPVALTHALRVYDLPRHHDDPFDLLLVAQSQVEGLALITADRTIARYDIEVVW